MNIVKNVLIGLSISITLSFSHGDVVPQSVDTKGLKKVGQNLIVNPYRDNKLAIEIGKSGYNTNCARCHGLGAISGGIAPDLRELTANDDDLDEYFIGIVKSGVVRNGNVYMPPFKKILSSEAIWSIRTWIQTIPAD